MLLGSFFPTEVANPFLFPTLRRGTVSPISPLNCGYDHVVAVRVTRTELAEERIASGLCSQMQSAIERSFPVKAFELTNSVLYTVPVRVIFSCENKTYMWWQAEFLHYTYSIAGMQSELTALVAPTDEPEREFTCNTVRVGNYKDSVPDAPLLTLNKPGGIAEWAALDGPGDETVLIVDPDSVSYAACLIPAQ